MTSTQKPLLLLDVDGVLNAFQPARPHTVRKLGGRTHNGVFTPYTVRFDNEIVEMIDALAEHFEIHWATMWNHKANTEIAAALGVDHSPVMVCNHFAGWDIAKDEERLTDAEIKRLWYAKTPLIPAYVADRPFAWVDDDHSGADLRYLNERLDQDFFLCQTDAYSGLTWRDVAELITWASTLGAGTPAAKGNHAPPVFVPQPDPVLYFDEPVKIDWDSDEVRELLSAMDD